MSGDIEGKCVSNLESDDKFSRTEKWRVIGRSVSVGSGSRYL